MTILLVEIWLWLIVAALSGVAAGWLIWGRATERIQAVYRGRLARLRRNWETVEEQLVTALARIAELEHALNDRKRDFDPRENAIPSNGLDREDDWRDERRLLEATVRGLNERIQSLEAQPLLQNAVVDAPTSDRLPSETGI